MAKRVHAEQRHLRVVDGGANEGDAPPLDDDELIDAFEGGDRRTAERLYDRLDNVVGATLVKVLGGRGQDHEDLIQAAFEQIQDVLPKAVQAAATKKYVTLILNRDTGAVVLRDPAYDMNKDVTAELDALLPVAQLSPPPGWLPREQRERQQAALAAQAASGQPAPAGAAPATTPAGTPTDSR